jgi:hypothetical protein
VKEGNDMSLFKKAERKRAFLKLALTGPSGSGKTLSALLLASGLGKKIAVLDTENGSASLYSEKVDFDVVELAPPFQTERYIHVIKEAEKAGYDVLVIDSMTHAWAGEGGLLQQKEEMDARGGNSYTNWAKLTPKDNAFRSAILQSQMHVIVTMRSKQDYVLQENNKGKQAPIKVGLAPVQREGMEYEFTTVLDLAMNHQAQASKDRTGLFDGQFFTPSQETGEKLLAWLNSAPESAPVDAPKTPAAFVPPPPALDPLDYKFEWGATIDKGGLKGLTLREAIDGRPEDSETKTPRFDGVGIEGVKKYLAKTNDWLQREKKPKFHGLAMAEKKFAEYEKIVERQLEEAADGWTGEDFDNGLDAALMRGAK